MDAYQPQAEAIVWVWSWVIDRGEWAFGFRQHRATAIWREETNGVEESENCTKILQKHLTVLSNHLHQLVKEKLIMLIVVLMFLV